mmetsp:Transcript_58478/g.69794  ORF Transcript_58478/g.69794 Transcript_58478/m.69794 type:complete len:224 (-) Transcript_58478:171-842(-)
MESASSNITVKKPGMTADNIYQISYSRASSCRGNGVFLRIVHKAPNGEPLRPSVPSQVEKRRKSRRERMCHRRRDGRQGGEIRWRSACGRKRRKRRQVPCASIPKIPVGYQAIPEKYRERQGLPKKSKSARARERQKAAKQRALEEEKRMALLKEEQERKAKQEKEAEAKANVDPEKRAKKIRKSLKQIADLKSRERSELNVDQLNKIAMEDELVKELESLGL